MDGLRVGEGLGVRDTRVVAGLYLVVLGSLDWEWENHTNRDSGNQPRPSNPGRNICPEKFYGDFNQKAGPDEYFESHDMSIDFVRRCEIKDSNQDQESGNDGERNLLLAPQHKACTQQPHAPNQTVVQ